MFRPRSIAIFSLRFTIVYVLLAAPWPGLVEAYGKLYGSAVRGLFGSSGWQRSVEVRRFKPDQPLTATVMDTEILVSTGATASRGGMRPALQIIRSSRDTGYLPTALVLSLIAATPLARSRKRDALIWGFIFVSWYVALVPGLMIHDWIFQEEARLASDAGVSPLRGVLHMASRISQWMGAYFVLPVLLWLLLIFDRERWGRVIQELTSQDAITSES